MPTQEKTTINQQPELDTLSNKSGTHTRTGEAKEKVAKNLEKKSDLVFDGRGYGTLD